MVPVAIALTVLVSTYLVRVKTMWRQARITAAIVISASLAGASTKVGVAPGRRSALRQHRRNAGQLDDVGALARKAPAQQLYSGAIRKSPLSLISPPTAPPLFTLQPHHLHFFLNAAFLPCRAQI